MRTNMFCVSRNTGCSLLVRIVSVAFVGCVLFFLAACGSSSMQPIAIAKAKAPTPKYSTAKPTTKQKSSAAVKKHTHQNPVVRPKPKNAQSPANQPTPATALDTETKSENQEITVSRLSQPVEETDLWERIRKGFVIPDLKNTATNRRTQWYAGQPEYMQRMTNRSRKYLYHIVTELEKRNMPTELALLPFVESAFNPEAISKAKAVGMWQFMPQTGREFDLKQTMFRDERRSIRASTSAALDYLQQLYDQFGDWHLALAAYNWGPGNVQKAVARNQRRGRSTSYTHLRMPRETAGYVPKLQAIENIVANPGAFGIVLPDVENHPYFQTITIDRDIDVALAASLAEIPEADFRSLNPGTKKPVILAETSPDILLPWSQAEVFIENLKNYQGLLSSWTVWRVPKTMNPAQAARMVGMSEKALRNANGIGHGLLVRSGSTLLVHRTQAQTDNIAAHIAESARLRLQPEYVRKTVVVRRGDTLSEIAARYGVSVNRLARLNNLSRKSLIRIGQRLQVITPRYRGKGQYRRFDSNNGVVTVRKGDTLSEIAHHHGMSVGALARLNGISQQSMLRIGQQLKVDGTSLATHSSKRNAAIITVRKGDTLSEIAQHYGMGVAELARLNSISQNSMLGVGQKLRVRSTKRRKVHVRQMVVVRRGDTLSGIAQRYGMGVAELARLNGISQNSVLGIGQKLRVNGASKKQREAHVTQTVLVRRGDTLSEIAQRYGIGVGELARLNGISQKSLLSIGQRLKVLGP